VRRKNWRKICTNNVHTQYENGWKKNREERNEKEDYLQRSNIKKYLMISGSMVRFVDK
jgi:hypothetical protein